MGNTYKTTILFLIGHLGVGGKERQLIELIRNLPEASFSIVLIAKSIDTPFINKIPIEVSVINLNQKKFNFKSLVKIKNHICRIKPELIHSWATPTSFFLCIIKPILVKNRITFIDGSIRQAHYPKDRFFIYSIQRILISKLADIIVTNSYSGLRHFGIINNGCVIYNGFDISRIINNNQSNSASITSGRIYIIGMVARFDPIKDYITYIHSALKILTKRKDVLFYSIGDGILLSEVKKLIPRELLANFVFTGSIGNVEDYISTFDIAILSTKSEGISNSILEYMAHRKPVIASNVNGVSEIIRDSENGFLVEGGNINQLVDRILMLIDSEELRRRIGENGYKTVSQQFSLDSMVTNFTNLYIKLRLKN